MSNEKSKVKRIIVEREDGIILELRNVEADIWWGDTKMARKQLSVMPIDWNKYGNIDEFIRITDFIKDENKAEKERTLNRYEVRGNIPKLKKLFSFNNLNVKVKNAPDGRAYIEHNSKPMDFEDITFHEWRFIP